jgi:hypothetical protein
MLQNPGYERIINYMYYNMDAALDTLEYRMEVVDLLMQITQTHTIVTGMFSFTNFFHDWIQ